MSARERGQGARTHGLGAIAIALIDNLPYPILVGSQLRFHPMPVFIAVVGGLTVFGAAGLILGPVTLAVTMALIEVWRLRTAHGRAAEAPVRDTERIA